MKREVWVECGQKEGILMRPENPEGLSVRMKQIEIHESLWIPVGERMPTEADYYEVVRLDRRDWCYCEIQKTEDPKITVRVFTSKGVTHWREHLPLPVDEDGFDHWIKKEFGPCLLTQEAMDLMRMAWDRSKESK